MNNQFLKTDSNFSTLPVDLRDFLTGIQRENPVGMKSDFFRKMLDLTNPDILKAWKMLEANRVQASSNQKSLEGYYLSYSLYIDNCIQKTPVLSLSSQDRLDLEKDFSKGVKLINKVLRTIGYDLFIHSKNNNELLIKKDLGYAKNAHGIFLREGKVGLSYLLERLEEEVQMDFSEASRRKASTMFILKLNEVHLKVCGKPMYLVIATLADIFFPKGCDRNFTENEISSIISKDCKK